MSSGKVVVALLAGIAAGAVLGILFAPAKGSDTRKEISGKGEGLKESIKEKFNEFLDDISEKYDDVVADAEDMTESSKGSDKKSRTASV